MNKNEFLNAINYEDKISLANLYDKYLISQKVDKPIFSSEFYPPNVWNSLSKLTKKLNINISSYGIFEECEKKIIGFSQSKFENFEETFPLTLVKINNKSKFSILEHKDFLGSIMSLGIKREKFGDLIIENNSCWVAVLSDIVPFLIENLTSIGKSPCTVETHSIENTLIPSFKFEEINCIITSLRLDSLIASICNISRNDAVSLIEDGNVLLNYEPSLEKNHTINLPSTVSIRKYGKYRIEELLGETKKGKLKIGVKKYI